MNNHKTLIPVNVVTGFLGSGKTTLLQRILNFRSMNQTVVLVNEFGEVGLDHHLLEHIDENTVLLQSGCICCTIREDLTTSLLNLLDRQATKKLKFRRIVVETTGLADPAPIIYSLTAGDLIRHHFRLGNIITTIDAINGIRHLEKHPESEKQVAVADRIVVTKTDIAKKNLSILLDSLTNLNPTSPIYQNNEPLSPAILLTNDIYDPKTKSNEVARWIDAEAFRNVETHAHNRNRHSESIQSFCLDFDRPIDWTIFGIWLTMLLQIHGEKILRVKGILNIADLETPVAVHGVQHVVHPPVHLKSWPDWDRKSKIVFIVRDLPPEKIQKSLSVFNMLGSY